MKILHVTQHFLPFLGGVEISVYEICKRLVGRGYSVEVICQQEKSTPKCENLAGVDVYRVRAYEPIRLKYSIGAISPRMLRHVSRSDADLIHAHAYGFFPTWTTLISEKPTIITTHSNPMSRIYPMGDLLRVVPVKLCDRVVAVTEMEKVHLMKRGIRRDRITVIPNGITLPPPLGRDVGFHPMILCLGRVDMDHKGQDVLLLAMKRVLKSVSTAKLVVAGNGKDFVRAKTMAKELGLMPSTILTGSLSETDKWNYLNSCDVLCIPSRTEPFSIVCLEGMSLGKPIVATDAGGIVEVAKGAAIFVPREDPISLADALIRVLKDKDMADELGRNAVRRVQRFNWDLVFPKYEALYKELA